MKLGHIVKYYNIYFFKFDNGLYRTMHSGLLPFIHENLPFFDGVWSLKSSNFDHNFMKLIHNV